MTQKTSRANEKTRSSLTKYNNRNNRKYASDQNLATTTTAGLEEVASQFKILTLGDLFRLILKYRPKIRVQFKLNEFTLVLHVLMKKTVTLANHHQFSPPPQAQILKPDVQNLLEIKNCRSNCSSPLSGSIYSMSSYNSSSSRSISRSTSLESMNSFRTRSSLSNSLESMYSSNRSSSLESMSEISPYHSSNNTVSYRNPNNDCNKQLTSAQRSPSFTEISVSIEIEIYLNSKGITSSNQQVSKYITQ